MITVFLCSFFLASINVGFADSNEGGEDNDAGLIILYPNNYDSISFDPAKGGLPVIVFEDRTGGVVDHYEVLLANNPDFSQADRYDAGTDFFLVLSDWLAEEVVKPDGQYFCMVQGIGVEPYAPVISESDVVAFEFWNLGNQDDYMNIRILLGFIGCDRGCSENSYVSATRLYPSGVGRLIELRIWFRFPKWRIFFYGGLLSPKKYRVVPERCLCPFDPKIIDLGAETPSYYRLDFWPSPH